MLRHDNQIGHQMLQIIATRKGYKIEIKDNHDKEQQLYDLKRFFNAQGDKLKLAKQKAQQRRKEKKGENVPIEIDTIIEEKSILSEKENVYAVQIQYMIEVNIEGIQTTAMIYTGAQVSVMTTKTAMEIKNTRNELFRKN